MTSEDPLPIIEPFRIKSVEPLRVSTRAERGAWLDAAHGNLFALRSEQVMIDLLTDSGTGAMSSDQWAALMRGDESYAGSPSFFRFERAVREVFGFEHVVPTHQGRAAEHFLLEALVQPGDVVPNNTHFDTTRANVVACGGEPLDLPCPQLADTASREPFKGDIDLEVLERVLTGPRRVPLAMITLTNNAGGGQPASLGNVRAMSELCRRHGVPLFVDACRFAENAWLMRERDPELAGVDVGELVRRTFALADGCTMSAKKDGLANIGGFLGMRDPKLAETVRRAMVVTEGFPTYGGLSGRDLEAVAQGLREVLQEDYLEYRHASVAYVARRLAERGVPVVEPPGGHAIFLDAARFLPHVPRAEYPGQAVASELYLEGGVRACEIGSVMLGAVDAATGAETPAAQELVRLAVPRRTYTQSHMDYVIEVVARVHARRERIGGVRIVESPPVLRHFGAKFRRVRRRGEARVS
ncbi:MAG: tryptophanase [Planctomycetes bacterium]|nr:tryptophanase [Planctomycetota bacterium]